MTEPDNRLYAVDLLKRADVAFDVRDVNVVAAIIGVIEGDFAAWVQRNVSGSVTRDQMTLAVATGAHRPADLQTLGSKS